MRKTNKTIKLKYKKNDKQSSIFKVKVTIDVIMIHDPKEQGRLTPNQIKILSKDFGTLIVLFK